MKILKTEGKREKKKTLTCPIIFKAVEKMETHQDQSVERDECNVHLGQEDKRWHIIKQLIKKIKFTELHNGTELQNKKKTSDSLRAVILR